MVWIGSIWLRIGTGGGLMWTRWWTSGLHKMLGSSRVAAQLAASREGLSSMSEWVSEWVSDYQTTFIILKKKIKNAYAIFMLSVCLCVPHYQLLNRWINIYEILYAYHDTWAHPTSLCVCMCITLLLLGNGSVKPSWRQWMHMQQ
jgi:hypothetical protein